MQCTQKSTLTQSSQVVDTVQEEHGWSRHFRERVSNDLSVSVVTVVQWTPHLVGHSTVVRQQWKRWHRLNFASLSLSVCESQRDSPKWHLSLGEVAAVRYTLHKEQHSMRRGSCTHIVNTSVWSVDALSSNILCTCLFTHFVARGSKTPKTVQPDAFTCNIKTDILGTQQQRSTDLWKHVWAWQLTCSSRACRATGLVAGAS